MPTRSQTPQIAWDLDPGFGQPVWNNATSRGGGGGGGMDLNDLLMANQYGSFLNFPGAMNDAMGQMYGVNQGNQQASLYTKALQAQLQAMLGSAAYGAYGDIGSGYMQRLQQNDLLNNPLYAEQVRGNLGTSIAQIQNKGMMDAINAKGSIARDLFGSMMGAFGGSLGGGGGLRGFEATDGSGMKAMLPAASSGSPVPQPATTGAAPVPTQPVTGAAQTPAVGGNLTPNMFAQPSGRSGGQANPALEMSRKYLMDYLARGGR